MHIATRANVRTTQAARSSLSEAFRVSFQGGAVMGLGVAGLVVVGMGSLFIVLYQIFVPEGADLTGSRDASCHRGTDGFFIRRRVDRALRAP